MTLNYLFKATKVAIPPKYYYSRRNSRLAVKQVMCNEVRY